MKMDPFIFPDRRAKPAMPFDGGGGGCRYPDCEPSPKKELVVERIDYFRSQNVISTLNDWRFLSTMETTPFIEYAALVNPRMVAHVLKKHPDICENIYEKSREMENLLATKGDPEILLNKALADLTSQTSKPVMADLAREFLSWYVIKGVEIEKVVTQQTDYEKWKRFFFWNPAPPLHPSRRVVFDELKKSLEKANDFSAAKRMASVLVEASFHGEENGFKKEAEDFLMAIVRKEKPIAAVKAVVEVLANHPFRSHFIEKFIGLIPQIRDPKLQNFFLSILIHPQHRYSSISKLDIVKMALEVFPTVYDMATANNFIAGLSERLGESSGEKRYGSVVLLFLDILEEPSHFAFMTSPRCQDGRDRLLEAVVYALVKAVQRGSKSDDPEGRLIQFARSHSKEAVGRFTASLLAPRIEDPGIKKELQSIAGLQPSHFPPYQKMFADGSFRARLYFLNDSFFSERWKKWLAEEFGAPRLSAGELSYHRSGMKIDVQVGGKNGKSMNLFEKVEGSPVDYRGYFGHAGGGAELRSSLSDLEEKGETSIVQISACGSLNLYGPSVGRLYPEAQVIGTRATTWEPTNPRYFAAILEGIGARQSWEQIRRRTTHWRFGGSEKPNNTVFPDEADQLEFRDSDSDGIVDAHDNVYNLGDHGPPSTRDSFEFVATSREPSQNLGEVISFLRARFSSEKRLRPFADLRFPRENSDGFRNHGWFRHRLDHQTFLKEPVENFGAENRPFFEFEINAGYQFVSPLLLKIAAYYELGSYFLKNSELTEEERLALFLRSAEAIFLEYDSSVGRLAPERYERAYELYLEHFGLPRLSFATAYQAYKSKEFAGSERTPETERALEQVRQALRAHHSRR